MDKNLVAKELVKLAKSLLAVNPKEAKKIRLLENLADAIVEVVGKSGYGKPKIFTPDHGGWDTVTFAWDGPYDWVDITMGSSIFAGELGTASAPVEPQIEKALKELERAGFFLEPINNSQIGVYDNN
jgi:hypothetical protein